MRSGICVITLTKDGQTLEAQGARDVLEPFVPALRNKGYRVELRRL